MPLFKQRVSEIIWNLKYRYRDQNKIIDQRIEDTWERVANAIASAEKKEMRPYWAQRFYQLLEDFRFLPGGRILAGAGTKHRVTLFNCFVMNIATDSLKGIFDALEEGALTLQQGGGVGYDFSVLRPAGAVAKKTGLSAAGPVSFMRIWDTTSQTLLSTGARRGAMMGVLRCDHPDIEIFIEAKKDPKMLRHFNISIMVDDEFMRAVTENRAWALAFPAEKGEVVDRAIYKTWGQHRSPVRCKVYKEVNARELWERIIRAAYDYAEPGVLFADTINRNNTLWYREHIAATNPCGEIPLPPYGACNLGAINLTQFISAPFTERAEINWVRLEEAVCLASRFQDDVIDVSHFPYKKQREQAYGTRRIGLGITGLADALIMLGISYGSDQGVLFAQRLMRKISQVTWDTSIELAKEKGAFPFYDRRYLEGEFVKTLDEDIKKKLAKEGIRNSHHNTIAPTGTISLLANNCSNGIEPVFKADYDRHIRLQEKTCTFQVRDYALLLWESEHRSGTPPAWVDVESLTPQAHLRMQAAVQPFIDNAISKTINIPKDFPFDQLSQIYTQAYELGLKGCTIFRPNPITGSVLEVRKSEDQLAVEYCCQFEE